MTPCYDAVARAERQIPDLVALVGGAVAVAVGVATRQVVVAVICGLVSASLVAGRGVYRAWGDRRSCQGIAWVVLVIAVLGVVATMRAATEHSERDRVEFGPYRGWARVVLEATPTRWGMRMILALDGRRFEVVLSESTSMGDPASMGDPVSTALTALRQGEWVLVTGERHRLDEDRAARVAPAHIVGRLRVWMTGEVRAANRLDRLIAGLRTTITDGADYVGVERRPLFLGLVIGEDAGQTDEMVERFRATGLSHLMVVSGANVAVVLAAATPVLRRLSAAARWSASVGLILAFAALTRFEPSILRASMMAIVGVSALTIGRERSAIGALLIAVIVVLFVDPILVGSYALWLSVGATAGICVPGVWLERRLRRSRWWAQRWSLRAIAAPLAATLGAQVGVIVPMAMMGVPIPVIGVVCNLLAGPAAGFVTAYGLPVSVVTGVIGPLVPGLASLAMWPVDVAVAWIDLVARVGERFGPTGTAGWVMWLIVASAVLIAVSAGGAVRRDG